MAIIGTLLKKGILLRESLEQQYTSPHELQKQELRKLMIHCRHTQFGRHYHFDELLKKFKSKGANEYYEKFRTAIPIFDYERINESWWHLAREGKSDVCWPGRSIHPRNIIQKHSQ